LECPALLKIGACWRGLAGHPDFYGTLPLMPDDLELFARSDISISSSSLAYQSEIIPAKGISSSMNYGNTPLERRKRHFVHYNRSTMA